MAGGQLTHCLLSCSPGGQVSLAVGLAPEVISLSLLCCRHCLAGLGVAYGGRPQLLVGGCMVWDCRRIGGPEGHFFPAGDWVVAVHLLLLAESPCWPVEAGCWWVGNMTCHLQRGGNTSHLAFHCSCCCPYASPTRCMGYPGPYIGSGVGRLGQGNGQMW